MRKPKSKQRIVLRTIIPEIMLEVFFCNVGDGDAILLREFREGVRDYNILVDAGRPYLEPKQGSLRKEAIYYLKARGIDHLDRMILTHLHIDHIGGALRILNAIPTESLTVLNLPPQDAEWVAQSFESADKAVNGLCYALNIFRDITERAKELGCCLETAFPGEIALSDRLTMTTYLPRNEIILRQQSVFNRLYRNEPVDYDECYRVSKERNHSSLMLGFIYAGRPYSSGGRFVNGVSYGAKREQVGGNASNLRRNTAARSQEDDRLMLLAREQAEALYARTNDDHYRNDVARQNVLDMQTELQHTLTTLHDRYGYDVGAMQRSLDSMVLVNQTKNELSANARQIVNANGIKTQGGGDQDASR